ncbi:MAG: tripartite tricarboxylate transporter substrate binding protein, partial [Comamonadaceae bacterium]
MSTSYFRALAIAAVALVVQPTHAQASFPAKAVTLIVPYGAGGSADILARSLGDKLSKAWGVPVLVDNRTGANGIVATQALMRAPADGHTILLH